MKIHPILCLAALLSCCADVALAQEAKGLKVLQVSAVKTNENLAAQMAANGKLVPMGRVMNSLNKKVHAALQQTRKFRLVVGADLKVIIDAQGLTSAGTGLYNQSTAPQQGELVAPQFSSVVTIDHFLDSKTDTTLGALRVRRTTRKIQIGGILNITDLTTGLDLENAEITVTQDDELEERPGQTLRDADDMDELLTKAASEFANKVANRVVDAMYPMKVIDREDDLVTINRSDSSGIKLGEILAVYGPTKAIKDPDTGKMTNRKGKQLGKVEVTEIEPDYFQAKVTQEDKAGSSIVVGSVLSRATPAKP